MAEQCPVGIVTRAGVFTLGDDQQWYRDHISVAPVEGADFTRQLICSVNGMENLVPIREIRRGAETIRCTETRAGRYEPLSEEAKSMLLPLIKKAEEFYRKNGFSTE